MLYAKLKLEERVNLNVNGPGNYKLTDGKVHTSALEINAVKHCNLSCRSCSHSSPISEKRCYDLMQLKEDLNNLSKYFKCEFIRVVGGEPLLHPDLVGFLRVIRESNIGRKICLVTNGVFLGKVKEDILELIDKVEISLYPMSDVLKKQIEKNADTISRSGKSVRILEYSDFRESVVKKRCSNDALVQVVYNTCGVAHTWRCLTLDNGRLFRCPQSMVCFDSNNAINEGIIVSEINNVNEVLDFLEDNNFIESCRKCLGSVGKQFQQQQILRDEWYEALPDDIESGIDLEYANELGIDNQYVSDNFVCKKLS